MGARPLLVCTCIVFLALLATSSAQPQPPAYSLQRLLAVSGDPPRLALVVVSCCITLTLVVQRTCC
jgi:hypothetical protein